MKTIIHVNQHHIKWNQKHKDEEPRPIFTVKTGRSNLYAEEVNILGPSKLVYQPDKPLQCGARAWIETHADVELVNPQTFAEIHE